MSRRREKRHPLDNVSPERAIQARCITCNKIVLVGEFRDELLPAVIRHYEKHHGYGDELVTVMLEGSRGHFTIEPVPPARCDLCAVAAERPWWVWVTPWAPDYNVQDPAWLVCDGCHPLVEAHDTLGLARRVWEVSSAEFVWDDERRRRDDIREVVTRFLSHVDPSQTRREAA